MPRETRQDVVVIGGGVMGLFTAIDLRRLGVERITLIEKRFCGAGSSGKSGAICRQHYSNEITAKLALDSLSVFAAFEKDYAVMGAFTRTGCLFFAPAAHRETMTKNVELQRSWGINTAMIDVDGAKSIEQRFDFSDAPAVCFEPDSGYCDPMMILHGLESAAKSMGVNLLIGSSAVALNRSGTRISSAALEDGTAIAADVFVNCAGPWAAPLAATVGIELPIRVTKPQIAFTLRPVEARAAHPVVCDLVYSYYTRPDLPGQSLIGGLDMEIDPPVSDPDEEGEGIDDSVVSELNDRLRRRMPSMDRARSRGGMGALYACTPDYHPIIGAHREFPNLYTCSGFSGHGFKLSPFVGRNLAHKIARGTWSTHDLDLFRPTRFAEGQPVRGRYEYSILG